MNEALRIDFPACLARDFASELVAAEWAVAAVTDAITRADFTPLEQRSPGLKGIDWAQYIRSSLVRMARTSRALTTLGVVRGRLLDYGSYFGNFSLMFARGGFEVSALDAYGTYGEALKPQTDVLRRHGVEVLDFESIGRELHGVPPASFDAIICLGVIEHVPHTPRPLLTALDRALKPDGCLVLDTPNIAYLYKRQALARGDSVMPDIEVQFNAEVPFEGHHREYAVHELLWMLDQLGHIDLHLQMYLFSLYELGTLRGRDVENFRAMVADPSMRELILTASRKPAGGASARSGAVPSWRQCLIEPERWWFDEPLAAAGAPAVDVAQETLAAQLQREVNIRDEMLARLQADMQREVALRDDMLQTLQDQLNRLTRPA